MAVVVNTNTAATLAAGNLTATHRSLQHASTTLARMQVLAQAGASMLTRANASHQIALKLLAA